jgi:hypothetical protein
MKKSIVVILAAFMLLLPIQAQENLTDVLGGFNDVFEKLFNTLPHSVAQSSVWPEAYIGQLPHFGIGLPLGFTRLDMSPIFNALESYDVGDSIPPALSNLKSDIPYPSFALDAKIGGFILPFDFGFAIMALPSITTDEVSLNFFSIGFSARYAVLQDKGLLPAVSVGVGYNYAKTELEIGVDGVTAGISFQTSALDFNAQVSKKFVKVLIPYIGFRGIFAVSKGSLSMGYNAAWSENGHTYTANQKLEKDFDRGFGDSFSPVVFGGLGLQLAAIQLNIGGSFDMRHRQWGFNSTFRVKI